MKKEWEHSHLQKIWNLRVLPVVESKILIDIVCLFPAHLEALPQPRLAFPTWWMHQEWLVLCDVLRDPSLLQVYKDRLRNLVADFIQSWVEL